MECLFTLHPTLRFQMILLVTSLLRFALLGLRPKLSTANLELVSFTGSLVQRRLIQALLVGVALSVCLCSFGLGLDWQSGGTPIL